MLTWPRLERSRLLRMRSQLLPLRIDFNNYGWVVLGVQEKLLGPDYKDFLVR